MQFSLIYSSCASGQGYRSDEIFDLSTMQPYSLNKIYESLAKVSPDIALYLPRTSDLRQLAKYAPEGRKVEVVHYCMEGASKVSANASVCRSEWC